MPDRTDGIAYGLPALDIFYRREILKRGNFIISMDFINSFPRPFGSNSPLMNNLFMYSKDMQTCLVDNSGCVNLYNTNQTQVQFVGYNSSDLKTGFWGADGVKGFFVSASAGYRMLVNVTNGDVMQQMRFYFSIGVHLTSRFTIILDLIKILGPGYVPGGNYIINNPLTYQYDIVKGILYFIHRIGDGTSVVSGILIDLGWKYSTLEDGMFKNSGVKLTEGGVMIGLWQKF